MDLKRLMPYFTYHIEAKSGGGFIARAADPSLPPLEAFTRPELQEKIRQNISTALAAEFPGLKLPAENQQFKATFHIERNSDGSFAIHTSDPNSQPIHAAPHEIESKFAERFIGFVGKHVLPQLSPELATQLTSGDIKVFVSRKVTRTGIFKPTGTQMLSPASLLKSLEASAQSETPTNLISATSGSISDSDSPIKPETGSGWNLLRFLFALLIIGAIAYFLLRYR
jgi:hypothetical protein